MKLFFDRGVLVSLMQNLIEEPLAWKKGINLATFGKLKLDTFNFNELLTKIHDAQVDALFEETPTQPPTKINKTETVAMESKQVEKEITDALRKSTNGLKRSRTPADAEDVVKEWFSTFHKNGMAGNVGLVPETLQEAYPNDAPAVLDPNIKAHVMHFYEWFLEK